MLMLQQKRSELLRLLFIVALLALTAGVVLVLSANNPTATIMTTPSVVNASANQTLNFTITNPAGSTEIDAVRVQRASGFTTIDCGVKLPPGWSCDDTTSALQIDFVSGGTGIAAGASVPFMINGLAPATTGNQTFLITPYEGSIADGTQNTTLNPVNVTVTVDADAPRISNITIYNMSGAIVANATTLANGTLKLRLTDFIVNLTVSDTGGGSPSGVAVYFNSSRAPSVNATNPYDSKTYSGVAVMSNASNPRIPNSDVYFNATILNSSFIANGFGTFAFLANDTLGNTNVTNVSSWITGQNSASIFNVTFDGDAPLMYNFSMTNTSSVVTVANVTTSNRTLLLSISVNDSNTPTNSNGSGVLSVVVYTSDNATKTTALTQSGSSPIWNVSDVSLLSLGANTGDHRINLTFIAKDAVGNENRTIITDVEIDDDAPQFSLNSNYSNNFTTTNNSQINITATISNNLNLTHNVTINGPNGLIFNASLNVGTVTSAINGTSTWFTVKLNVTGGIFPTAETGNHTLSFSNLSQYGCPGGAETDGFVCQLQLNATDIFGRPNSTNITITLDNVAPAIVNITMNSTAASQRTNIVFKGGTQLNFTANAYNNIVNVTIGNASITSLSHVMPVVAGNYSFLINVSDFCVQQGACTINFSATDQAGNYNNSLVDSEGASFLILRDDIVPAVENLSISLSVGNLSLTGSGMPVGTGAVRVAKSTQSINITADAVDYNGTSTVTAFTLQNATVRQMSRTNPDNSSWNNVTTLAQLGCSENVESQCVITFNATDNASNVNNSIVSPQLNLTFRVDDLKPRVANFTTNLTYNHRITATGTLINFTVNVTDANLVNVSLANTTIILMNRSSAATTSNSTSVVWTVATTWSSLGCGASDGNCTVTVYANDSAGNVNASQWISVNLDSSTIETSDAYNLSPQTAANGADAIDDPSPTLWINLTTNSLCRYSTTDVPYVSMTPMSGNGTPAHSVTPSDQIDGSYHYEFRCVDTLNVEPNGVFPMDIDFVINTTGKWNITVGSTGALSAKNDYFWTSNTLYSTVMLKNTNALATTSLKNTTYNVSNVLASLVSANPSGNTNNLTIVYAHNTLANTWTSYVPGAASGNDFNNFTSDVVTYYFNFSTSNERLEIN